MEEKNKNKKLTDEMLHEAALRMFELEEKQLEEEMKNAEPHVFSAEFEQKIAAILNGEDPRLKAAKRKKKMYRMLRYTAAIVVTAVLMVGVIFNGSESVTASNMRMQIKQWLADAFVIEEGVNKIQDEGVVFSVDQIGYLPDGFVLDAQEVDFVKASYRYRNNTGSIIRLKVLRDKFSSGVDNKQIQQDTYINEFGVEYHFIDTGDIKSDGLYWIDHRGQVYILIGNVAQEELVNIMNGIKYKGE